MHVMALVKTKRLPPPLDAPNRHHWGAYQIPNHPLTPSSAAISFMWPSCASLGSDLGSLIFRSLAAFSGPVHPMGFLINGLVRIDYHLALNHP